MLAPAAELRVSELLAKAATALGSLTVGVTVFIALSRVVSGLPTAFVEGGDLVVATGFLMYIGLRVAAIAVAALFYLYFGDKVARMLRKRMVSWQLLALIIAGLAVLLYSDYLLL